MFDIIRRIGSFTGKKKNIVYVLVNNGKEKSFVICFTEKKKLDKML